MRSNTKYKVKNIKKIIIVAGEESGDMYASNIINYFSERKDIIFYGMGSNRMKKTKAELLVDSSSLSVVGFFEIFKMYPKLLKALNTMKKSIHNINPDLLILIDYQEFNMKLAKYAKSKGIKVLFYISPQIWAWREKRIKNIKSCVDEMAVIFPFEEKYYKKHGLSSTYVGHPLVENNTYKKEYSKDNEYIGFFPGSRLNEVKKHIPIINEVINRIHKTNPEQRFIISNSENIDKKIYEKKFLNKDYVKIVTNENIYKTIDMCKVAVAASGTITLQIALKKIPMCVFYKLSNITYFIAKILVKTKFISLVNIVLEKNAVHEFIQGKATSENIESELNNLINNKSYRKEMITNFDLLERKLLNSSSKMTIYDLIESTL